MTLSGSALASSASTRPSPAPRRVLPIEEVLRWAIRDELPKRREEGGSLMSSPVHPMWTNGLFTRVDNWSREPGFPSAMGDAHPDALAIEAEIQALDIEALDISSYRVDDGLAPGNASDRALSRLDLRHVIAIVRRDVKAWLYTAAIKGTRPDAGGPVECEPAKSDNGKVTLWRTVSEPRGTGPDGQPWFVTHDQVAVSKGDARDHGLFCKLFWSRTVDDVAEDRARYAFWHAALVYLANALSFLTSIDVRPPVAPAMPWIETTASRSGVVLPSVRPLRSVPLQHRRPEGRRTVRRQASPVQHVTLSSSGTQKERA